MLRAAALPELPTRLLVTYYFAATSARLAPPATSSRISVFRRRRCSGRGGLEGWRGEPASKYLVHIFRVQLLFRGQGGLVQAAIIIRAHLRLFRLHISWTPSRRGRYYIPRWRPP